LIFNRSNSANQFTVFSGSGRLIKQGSGTLRLTGANDHTGGTIISAGTLSVGNGGTLGSIAGNVTNNSTLAFNRSNALTYGGSVSGTGAVTKSGTGTLTLFGANSYAGLTTVSTGVLNIQNADALGTAAAGTSVTSGAALQIEGGITVGAEALTLNGTGVSTSGALRNISGTNTYAGLVTLGAATRINSDAGTLTLSHAGTITGEGLGLSVGGAGNTTMASIIGTGTGALTKDGAGTLTLSGANTYTGATTISAGTLEVSGASGALTATSAVNINGGALLLSGSAADRISNTASISLGAETDSILQLSGAVIETLGSLTLAGGVGARVIDFGVTSGVLTLASLTAASNLPLHIWNWSGTTGTGGGTDRLVISSGFLGGSLEASNVSFFSGSGTGLYSGATTFTSGGELVPAASVAVPEPGTFFPAAVLVAGALLRRRRGRAHRSGGELA
jgi:autotransporter-associated beta strand protein